MAYALGLVTVFFTAFYSWRLLIMTFHGKPRADHHTMDHVHESPWIMLLPLVPLALGAIFVKPEDDSIAAAATIPEWEKVMPLFAAALPGIFFAYVFYMFKPAWPG